jgi:aminoglycoside 3-N-acetyltransferase
VGNGHPVVLALLAAVGPAGTVVMPSLSSDLSEPSRWVAPPVPEAWWPVIRGETPAFDAALTETTWMGAVVDCFRHHPGTVRSSHPADSFIACGPLAEEIVQAHPLSPAFGDGSPLSRLYDLDARIVLLGVGHGNNTSLHLAEHRAQWLGKPTIAYGAPVMVDGRREWVTYDDLDYDSDDFEALGAAFAASTGGETRVPLGYGEVTSCSMRAIVDFAVQWLAANRPPPAPGG